MRIATFGGKNHNVPHGKRCFANHACVLRTASAGETWAIMGRNRTAPSQSCVQRRMLDGRKQRFWITTLRTRTRERNKEQA
jgi:hypothetical protein